MTIDPETRATLRAYATVTEDDAKYLRRVRDALRRPNPELSYLATSLNVYAERLTCMAESLKRLSREPNVEIRPTIAVDPGPPWHNFEPPPPPPVVASTRLPAQPIISEHDLLTGEETSESVPIGVPDLEYRRQLVKDRLTMDSNVSDSSPVVRGTWVTVDHVVSLIVDGWSWAEIDRFHPELTEDDIRAALQYTVDRESAIR